MRGCFGNAFTTACTTSCARVGTEPVPNSLGTMSRSFTTDKTSTLYSKLQLEAVSSNTAGEHTSRKRCAPQSVICHHPVEQAVKLRAAFVWTCRPEDERCSKGDHSTTMQGIDELWVGVCLSQELQKSCSCISAPQRMACD